MQKPPTQVSLGPAANQILQRHATVVSLAGMENQRTMEAIYRALLSGQFQVVNAEHLNQPQPFPLHLEHVRSPRQGARCSSVQQRASYLHVEKQQSSAMASPLTFVMPTAMAMMTASRLRTMPVPTGRRGSEPQGNAG